MQLITQILFVSEKIDQGWESIVQKLITKDLLIKIYLKCN